MERDQAIADAGYTDEVAQMAQVTTGRIYECDGHGQEGHELAANHPVIVVGRQSLIDNQRIAIVSPTVQHTAQTTRCIGP